MVKETQEISATHVAGIGKTRAVTAEKLAPADHTIEVSVDVKAIRERRGPTQKEFVETYGLGLGTLKSWEQDRRSPDAITALYLHLIDRHPIAVKKLLSELKVSGIMTKEAGHAAVLTANAKVVREGQQPLLIQAEFAETYGLCLGTLKGWEQRRRSPDSTSSLYLHMINRFPELVQQVVADLKAEGKITLTPISKQL